MPTASQKAGSQPLNLGPPQALNGVGSMISAAFRQSEPSVAPGAQRFGVPITAQLQGDLLNAADAITSNMTNLVQELDHGK
jgi:hypothetical protein